MSTEPTNHPPASELADEVLASFADRNQGLLASALTIAIGRMVGRHARDHCAPLSILEDGIHRVSSVVRAVAAWHYNNRSMQ